MSDFYIDVPTSTDGNELTVDALDYLASRFPGWVPREGHLDVAMIEVVCRLIAENRDVASRVPSSIFRYFGRSLVGISPVSEASALVPSTWAVADERGYTIKADSLVAFNLASDQQAYFRTVDPVTIAPGQSSTASGEVLLRALNPGAAYNGIPAGPVDLVDAISFVRTVVTVGTTSGGVDAETDADYQDRLRAELRLLAPRPIRPEDFAVFARRIPGVDRAIGIDGYNPTNNSYGNERTVAVALADAQGNAVPALVRQQVKDYLEAQREVNFIVNTLDPTYTTVSVAASLKALPGFDPVAIRETCIAVIRSYLDPMSWDWSNIVRVNELEYLLRRVPGVAYVDAVTTPANDVILQGVAALVKAGSVNISVSSASEGQYSTGAI